MLFFETLSKLMTKAFNDCCVMSVQEYSSESTLVLPKCLREDLLQNMSKRAADMMRDVYWKDASEKFQRKYQKETW